MAEKILVVDDEDIIRESLSYILTKEKYEVTEAANGKVAFDMLKETSFDLVITDLEMPEMKGIELLDEIKKMNLQTSTIVITAYGSMETAIAALRGGASDYILKPVEFDELLIKVKNYLRCAICILKTEFSGKNYSVNMITQILSGRVRLYSRFLK
ncbi:MAG: response regulator [Ignavibacteriaceae bacterium]|nr:response regulator [Ignavibacteriaceae bacterium]